MALFLDTADLKEIEKFYGMGILRGVTTNSGHLGAAGVKGGLSGVKKHVLEIARVIDPYPLSVPVLVHDTKSMIDQANEIASWAKNINVKIPMHG